MGTKKIIFVCDGSKFHGGLTDRIKTILSVYYEAKKRNYPFYIYWVHPFNLEKFLIPNKINWLIEKPNIDNDTFSSIYIDATNNLYINYIKYLSLKIKILIFNKIKVYSNLAYNQNKYKELYFELFKPSIELERSIKNHQLKIGQPYWAASFRFGNSFGDFPDSVCPCLVIEEQELLLDKIIKELRVFINLLPDGIKLFVTSDSYYFLNAIKDLDNRIYFVDEKIIHFDRVTQCKDIQNIWLKTFLDQNLIMRANKVFQFLTTNMYKSAFPEFAALIGNKTYDLHKF